MGIVERIRNRATGAGCAMANFILMIIAAVLIVILVVVITVILTKKPKERLGVAQSDRIECPGISDSQCTKRFCRFDKVKKGPSCYMGKDSFGYMVVNVTQETNGSLIKLKRLSKKTPYGLSIENVIFKLTYLTENILRFQFKDADKERYEVPVQKDFPLLQNLSEVNASNLSYEFVHAKEAEVFHFQVKRVNGTVLWDTKIGALLLSDQYLQIGSYLPSENVYGLGEHVHDTLRHKMDFVSWPMFSRDRPPKSHVDQHNLYGVHPFYTCLESSAASHGVFFLNSNAMEATFMPSPAISFRTVGGILDFFIFVGDNPEHVIQLYTSLIGRPMMPPYWSLGFQLSRYGYRSLMNLQEVINRTRKARIPQAVQFLDIDHFDSFKDFTYDNWQFPNLPEFIKSEKSGRNLKWIIILDPAIPSASDYEPYTSGLEKSIYVKRGPFWNHTMFLPSMRNVNVTFGKVWPEDYAAFPDFFLEEAKQWWKDNIVKHRETISFDGLWIDMNEPANFETNAEKPKYCDMGEVKRKDCWALVCPTSPYDDPPYNPLLKITGNRMSRKTLCMGSVQGKHDTEYRHYDVHSLYGWSQTQPTLEAAQEATGTRSLVISRSTYPSSGRYAGHWLGDNHSGFKDLQLSLIGIMEFNLFGIPYVGADVCGFFGSAKENLCKRWMQVGAFYPFYRNHNGMDEADQDPAVYGEDMHTASRKAIQRRIALNPYLYTLFYRAHVDGNTVVRPVFHEFPLDPLTWDMDRQIMWGKSLLVTPILEENHRSVSLYLPKGEWWHFKYEKSRKEIFTERFVIETDADEYTPLHVRGGTILPVATYDWNNYPESDNVTTRNISLYIFPDQGESEGELFMDDGISKDTIENEAYALYTFKSEDCKLEISSEEYPNFKGPQPQLHKIFIFKALSVTNASDYSVTMDNELHIAIVSVNAEMKSVQELTWQDANGNCTMLD